MYKSIKEEWPEFEMLSEKQLKLIKDEEIENKINVDEEVKKMIEWINVQPHLPKYLDNEIKIRNFLYGRKYSIERAKRSLDAHYTMRGALPEYFANRDPLGEDIQNVMKVGYGGVLPKLTPEGYRITLCGKVCPNIIGSMEHYLKYLIMMCDLYLLKDYNRGLIIVFDYSMAPVRLMMMQLIPLIPKLVHYALDCYPNRIKQIYCINVPTYFEYMGNLIRSVLPGKLQKRLFIYGGERDYTKLQEIAGRDNLPTEFGGTLGPLDDLIETWNRLLCNNRDWFLGEGSKITNESRRETKNFDPEATFGMTGSFRKLTVD